MLGKYFRYVIKNYLFAVLALLFVAVYWMSAGKLPNASIVFPRVLTYFLVPLFLWNFVESLIGFRKTAAGDNPEGTKWDCGLHLSRPKIMVILVTLAYIVLMPILGFVVTTVLYLLVLSYYLGVRNYISLLLFTGVYTFAIYAVFVMWLRVRLPDGLLL